MPSQAEPLYQYYSQLSSQLSDQLSHQLSDQPSPPPDLGNGLVSSLQLGQGQCQGQGQGQGQGQQQFVGPKNAVSRSSSTAEARKQFLSTLAPVAACVSGRDTDSTVYTFHVSTSPPPSPAAPLPPAPHTTPRCRHTRNLPSKFTAVESRAPGL